MWRFFDNRVLFVPGDSNIFEWIPFLVEKWDFHGEIVSVCPPVVTPWVGYDDWLQKFSIDEELFLVKETIRKAQLNPSYRGHIRGISMAESTEILREYYKEMGYEDALAKNYTLPETVQVTASISLRHALWCEKDKSFLQTKDSELKPYGMVMPPIRGSHDLRILQQALRMNIIMGIDVFPSDIGHINTLVEQEILPPFSVSQMIQFRWGKYA